MKVYSMDDMPDTHVEGFGKGAETRYLGALAAGKNVYANIDTLPPPAPTAQSSTPTPCMRNFSYSV